MSSKYKNLILINVSNTGDVIVGKVANIDKVVGNDLAIYGLSFTTMVGETIWLPGNTFYKENIGVPQSSEAGSYVVCYIQDFIENVTKCREHLLVSIVKKVQELEVSLDRLRSQYTQARHTSKDLLPVIEAINEFKKEKE